MSDIKIKMNIPIKHFEEKETRIAKLSPILGSKGINTVMLLKEFDKYVLDRYDPKLKIIIPIKVKATLNKKTGKVSTYTIDYGTPLLTQLLKVKLNLDKLNKKTIQKESIDENLLKELIKAKFKIGEDDLRYNAKLLSVIGTLKSIGFKYNL